MANPYDDILYTGHPFDQTHPDRLATLARLFGMNPATVTACRVLELGCGDGGNLIPMAYQLPGSQFLGIDAGGAGIAAGQTLVQALGLRNLDLRRLDIMEVPSELGLFDYIIVHGVYSWVPAAVQEKILEVCRQQLKPDGVAYISYNVYPGGHLKKLVAEMLQYHARRFPQPEQQIENARALLAFLATGRSQQDGYTMLLQEEAESVASRRAQTIYHDELAEHNSAVYFREFAARAANHRLQYLAEADFFEMQDCALSPEVSGTLRKLGPTLIEKEQYLDFLKCRRFRQTLLCHDSIRLTRSVRSEQMRGYYVGAAAKPEGQGDASGSGHPFALAAIAAVAEAWPAVLSFDELLAAVRSRAGALADDELMLADLILFNFACGRFQLHVHAPRFVTEATVRPRASALARLQAERASFVTNLRHAPVHFEDDLGKRLLSLLDGNRDREALLAEMSAGTAEQDIDRGLNALAKLAFLEA